LRCSQNKVMPTMLPVMPLLRDELEVQDNKQRGAAADLPPGAGPGTPARAAGHDAHWPHPRAPKIV
jgi:hypothetical protein